MTKRLCRVLTASLVVLGLAAPTPAAPTQGIDPAARRLLNESALAYQRLTTFYCAFEQDQGSGEPNANLPRILTGTVYLKRPNKIALYITDLHDNAHQQVVSDASGYFWRTPGDPKHYVKDTPSDADAKLAFMDCNASTLFLHNLLNYSNDPWHYQFDEPVPPPFSLTLGASGIVNGVPVVTVIAETLISPYRVTTIYAIGKVDHLIRRITCLHKRRDGTINDSDIETYSDVEANQALPASAFVFVPPAGTRAATRGQLLALTSANQPPMYDVALKPGAMPTAIDARDMEEKPVSLDQYAGKVVMLDFWATWCGPCRGELPNVLATYKKHHAQGFEIVGISLDDDQSKLGAFVKANKMPWRQVCDGLGWKSAVAQAYKVNAIPFALIIGKDGKIAAVNARGPALEQAVAAALKK